MTISSFMKDPDAVLDYTIDWSSFLSSGDTITSSTWVSSSVDISIDSDSFTSTMTTVWLSGGIDGFSYEITNHVVTAYGREDDRVIIIEIEAEPTVMAEMMPAFRLHLGDINPASYRYIDDWLHVALESAVKALQRWWGDKYLFVEDGRHLIRNPNYTNFIEDEPPTIQDRDQRIIILMASILVKSGQLEANSWNVGSWKDAEIAVSNIETGRSKEFSMKLDWEELKSYLLPPTKRLAGALRVPHIITEE